MRLLKYIFSEIKNNWRFSILFVLNLALGLSGYVAIDGFQNSIDHTLEQKSKDVLGADLSISARRKITEVEKSLVQKINQAPVLSSEIVELYSMVSVPAQQTLSRLVEIKAIEANYPFYGKISVEPLSAAQDLNNHPVVWVYPEILKQFHLQLGDTLRLGQTDFKIISTVTNDSAAGISTSMAPRLYIGRQQLEATQLLQPGTIATQSVVFKIQDKNEDQLEELRKSIFKQMPDGDLNILTHKNSSEQVGRLLSYLNDFLGLTSLIGLFLAAMGGRFLAQSYFRNKQKDIAILMSLGMKSSTAIRMYASLLMFLGLAASLVALLMSTLILPILIQSVASLFPFELHLTLQFKTIFICMALSMFGSAILCLPQLYSLSQVSPLSLFSHLTTPLQSWKKTIALSIPGAVLFYILSIFVANSYMVAHIFLVSFILSAFLLYGLGYVLILILRRQVVPARAQSLLLSTFWGWRDLTRIPSATLSAFVALGLGVLLLNVIPQIQYSIQQELEDPTTSKLPSLFLFDIQDEQVQEYQSLLRNNSLDADQISPMIRARLTHVNDQPFDRGKGLSQGSTREEENEMRFRNRGFNLSYRDHLSSAESILKGRDFSSQKGEIAEISIEYRFAERLSLKIGDKLTFDIQSIPIQGKIVNLRKVKWTSFQPNFFILFQPGFLETAPKTFLSTLPHLSTDQKVDLQNQIVTALPNISMVDVSQIIQRLKSVIDQMSLALVLMAYICLTVGLMVLYSIAYNNAQSRRWDIGLLKAMGATPKLIRNQFLWNFTTIALMASFFGMLMSFATSYIFAWQLLDKTWAFTWSQPLFIFGLSWISACGITLLALRSALKTQPLELMRS